MLTIDELRAYVFPTSTTSQLPSTSKLLDGTTLTLVIVVLLESLKLVPLLILIFIMDSLSEPELTNHTTLSTFHTVTLTDQSSGEKHQKKKK